MKIDDLLKTPQLFAVKKDGILQTSGGLCGDKLELMMFWLFREHSVLGCGNPYWDSLCDSLAQAWVDYADGATIVPVTIVELESEDQ